MSQELYELHREVEGHDHRNMRETARYVFYAILGIIAAYIIL